MSRSLPPIGELEARYYPTVFCVDASLLAEGKGAEVNKVFQTFREITHEKDRYCRLDLAVLAYGIETTLVRDFSIEESFAFPSFSEQRRIKIGPCLQEALRMFDEKKLVYREKALDYRQPILVILSSGHANDKFDEVWQECQERIENGKLTVFCVSIGDYVAARFHLFPGEPFYEVMSHDDPKLKRFMWEMIFPWQFSGVEG